MSKEKKERNEVNLSPSIKAILNELATKQNHSLKSYMELVLINHANTNQPKK